MLVDIIYAILDKLEGRRRTRYAMAEMRRSNYTAAWHDMLPQNRRRAARWMA